MKATQHWFKCTNMMEVIILQMNLRKLTKRLFD